MLKKLMTMMGVLSLVVVSLSGCKEQAEKTNSAPPKIVFDSQKAQKHAQNNIISTQVSASPFPTDADYIRIEANLDQNKVQPDVFLNKVTSPDTKAVIVLARILNGEKVALPPAPLFIFEKNNNTWIQSFVAQGPLSPYFVEQRAPLEISLELVLLKDKLDGLAQDAQNQLDTYQNTYTLYSNESSESISRAADDFAQRIALVEEAALKDVARHNLPYLESLANTVSFLSDSANEAFHITLSAQGQASALALNHNRPPSYSDLMKTTIGTTTVRAALGDLENGFWSVPGDALRASCDAVTGALQERMGFSLRDSALVLWSMIQPHALFATQTDYIDQCIGQDMKNLLAEMGLSAPDTQVVRTSTQNLTQMNKSLSSVASLVRNAKDSALESIANMMSDNLVVRDEARLLFSTQPDQLISTAHDVVAPALSAQEAAEYLMMLPVKAYGCYSRGEGQRGQHRATLAQLENDPNLWQLDFAFNDENKISGIQLKKPSQLDFCRAIGQRTGANRCRFSGKDFPGLSADRCG